MRTISDMNSLVRPMVSYGLYGVCVPDGYLIRGSLWLIVTVAARRCSCSAHDST